MVIILAEVLAIRATMNGMIEASGADEVPIRRACRRCLLQQEPDAAVCNQGKSE